METDPSPRLRTVSKSVAAFPLNEFPADFAHLLGKELVYLLAAKGKADLEGSEWEAIFATCIGADWKPSNVGLDDVVMGNTAWGAKSVKSTRPSAQKQVRLISGRNSPVYSFDEKIDTRADPGLVGKLVLDIWNERVSAVRERFKHLRTVVLVKSDDLTEVVVFEFETIRFDPELFRWEWNKNHNLTGHDTPTVTSGSRTGRSSRWSRRFRRGTLLCASGSRKGWTRSRFCGRSVLTKHGSRWNKKPPEPART